MKNSTPVFLRNLRSYWSERELERLSKHRPELNKEMLWMHDVDNQCVIQVARTKEIVASVSLSALGEYE